MGEAGEHLLQTLLQAEVQDVPAAHLPGRHILHRLPGKPEQIVAIWV